VVIVSVLEDGPIPKRVLAAGASAYVGKGGNPVELVEAVREAARGRRYLGSGVAQNLALSNLGGDATPFDGLTRRELEVAMLLLQGLRQEDVAKRLSLSAKTVNTHKSRLFQKLGIDDGMSLARIARQYGLVDPSQAG
jgi:DNA-binding NarL/FixJ family response regulator